MWKKYNFFQYLKSILLARGNIRYINQRVIFNEKEYLTREIHNEDIKDLLAIEREVYEGEIPWDKSAFLSELNAPYPNLYLLIETQGKTVGFIGVRFKHGNGHVTNLVVKKDFQGQGIATYLLEEVKKYAIAHKCQSLSLEVRVSNIDAQRLYRKFGFVSRVIKKNYYHRNHEDALDMVYNFEDEENDSE